MALKIQYKATWGKTKVDSTSIYTYNFNYQRQKGGISMYEQWFSLGSK